LDACYEAEGNLGGRIGCYKRLLDHAEPAEHVDLMVRLGELERERGDLQAALDWFLQAASRRPESDKALDLAEAVARESESSDILVDHLELLSEQFEDEAILADLWARLGRILKEDVGDADAALAYYQRLHERDPQDLVVLGALEELYEDLEAPHERIEVLREIIDLRREQGAERHELVDQLSKIADVQRRHLDQQDAARQTYNDILDVEPNHVPALRGIREMYREQGRFEEVVESLHRELSLLSMDETEARVEALMTLGDTLRIHLDDPREAIHQYGQVLAEEPQHEGAVAAVEELLSEPELAREAALMLEPVFRDTESHAQLARALEARLEVSDDRFEEAEILDELIPLYAEELGEDEIAFEHACRQFELDPGREEVWLRVEQIGAKLDRWETVEALFSEHAPAGSDLEPDRVNLLRHLASIREHRLGLKEAALETWEQLYEAEPTDEAVVDALERLYRQLDEDEKLVEALEAKEAIVDNVEERIDLLLEMARLQEEVLDDGLTAIETYRRVLALEADHEEAAAALIRLYREFEEWTELEQIYEEQADLAIDPDRRRHFLLAQGRLRTEQLDDYAGAVDLLGRLVTEDPGDDEAVEALESLEEAIADLGDRPQLEFEIARILEPAYRSRREPAKLARVLETRIDHTDQPFEKVDLLDELVDMYLGRLEDPESAYSALARAVVADPDNPGRRRRLLEVADKLDRLEAGAKVLEVAAGDADPVTATEMNIELGALYEDRLQIPSEAISAYRRALEGNEHDRDVLNALERLYTNTENFEELANILRRQADFADPQRRAELLERVGALCEEALDRPHDALEAYTELLDERPDSLEAFDALERLNAELGQWMELVDVLRRRLDVARDDDERVAILERLADTYADKLDDQVEAVGVHREILQFEPNHRGSLEALEAIFEVRAEWHELVDILRRKLDS
ncbi:MAG: hypothetical protein ACOCV2_14570, partial [Persicimonas sp.]